MGKPTGFMDFERKTAEYRPVGERLSDYNDVIKYLSSEEIQTQAARCMDCGIPFCHSKGCPLYNLIPEWNDLVFKGKWEEALSRLEMSNNFPEITGRICPALCEASCTLSINSSPVTIKQIELAVVEYCFQNGLVKPKPPAVETGKKVAIIGSGPLGLACAYYLG
ncbi:MAG: glutamate synthase, partial [Syntrophales bacterium LBB04]|nr:glutamate synthase [Syntrophales bacterium LBB04]